MLRSKKMAVTGQPGSGKSTVCGFLAESGAEVISSDQIAHQLLDPHTECGKQVIALFGKEIVDNGKFDREKIAEVVFSNPAGLEKLEKIIHPRVLEEIEKRFQKTKAALFVVEIPLLFELGWEKFFDQTLLVVSNRKAAFMERLWRFLPTETKREKADIIIENNGSLDELKKQVFKLLTTR